MKLKYGVLIVVLVFLFAGACYAEGAELCKENGGAVYNVPGKSIGQVTAGKKVVENIVSVKNSMQEINSAILQEQLDKERIEGYLVKGKTGEHAPLVEIEDGKIASLTILTAKGNPAERYVFDDGVLVERVDYEIQKGDKNDPHAPLVEYQDGKIVSLIIFDNKGRPAKQYTFDDGYLTEESVYIYSKEKNIDIQKGDKKDPHGPLVEHAPLVETIDSRVASLTIFDKKGQPAEKYVFDDQGRLIQSYGYGKGKEDNLHMPLVVSEDGVVLSLTIFDKKGQPAEKYVFDQGMLVESIVYDGKGKVRDTPINTEPDPEPEQASPIHPLDLHNFPQIDHANSAANAAISLQATVTEIEENTDVTAKNNAKVKAQEANSRMTRQRINEKRKDMIKALEGSEDKENK